ncbi:hypothetical protein NONI108955_22645 [Nocardia ninae]|uniref:Uncharacterized protein n=1 Tax=Nocardia ninae NBRC 108245 TaxID=1210091 RepID=A0A511MCY7_9NOCA|nr:hypothetical protein [Nocardia ninae]GEM38534.1 hypothetical protein NN4_30530 [Nocardia ninae NBRC 108245]
MILLFHPHPRSWYVEDVELVAAVPVLGYGFRATLHCRHCDRVRTGVYLWPLLILRLGLMGIRDPAYQGKALELSEQMADDINASLI